MSTERTRDEGGKFEEKVTEQDILKLFDRADEPVLTASDLADALPIGRDAVYRRLRDMHEEDLVGKKKAGANAVVWWAKVAPRLSEEAKKRVEEVDRENAIPLEELDEELEE
ncbi:hypothetical protein ACEU6E_10870 (plasmid) [Halorutilales archaeon Cl-col2-1]